MDRIHAKSKPDKELRFGLGLVGLFILVRAQIWILNIVVQVAIGIDLHSGNYIK